jgi:hypothetical protein
MCRDGGLLDAAIPRFRLNGDGLSYSWLSIISVLVLGFHGRDGLRAVPFSRCYRAKSLVCERRGLVTPMPFDPKPAAFPIAATIRPAIKAEIR